MSGEPDDGWCTKPTPGGGYMLWPCEPQHTLAFNRFASGWIDGPQVAIHRVRNGQLHARRASHGRPSVRRAAGRDRSRGACSRSRPDRASAATGSSRPKVSRLHVVDQVPEGRHQPASAPVGANARRSARRRATTTSLGVGTSVTVHGVTVTVLGRTGDSYEVDGEWFVRMPPSELLHRRRRRRRVVRDARRRGRARSRLLSVTLHRASPIHVDRRSAFSLRFPRRRSITHPVYRCVLGKVGLIRLRVRSSVRRPAIAGQSPNGERK